MLMPSLEIGLLTRREHHLRSSSLNGAEKHPYLQRHKSRFPRLFSPKKLDYLQWTSTVVIFFFFVALFQIFLPPSVLEKSVAPDERSDLTSLDDTLGLNIREHPVFDRSEFFSKLKDAHTVNLSSRSNRTMLRFKSRKPQLAMVFSDLVVDSHKILMITVAAALKDLGYEIQVYSFEDVTVHYAWRNLSISIKILGKDRLVDWLNYDGILVTSVEAWPSIHNLVDEPFKYLPVIWTIQDESLAMSLKQHNASDGVDLNSNWKRLFQRATVVTFPSYELMRRYSDFDTGNYFLTLGEECGMMKEDNLHEKLGYSSTDFIIAIVRSRAVYRGIWLEHVLVLEALKPIVAELGYSRAKILALTGDSAGNYSKDVMVIAGSLDYPQGVVKHVAVDDGDSDDLLRISDVVIYGSFVEEISFPDVLVKALCLEKVILAPDLSIITKYVDEKATGYLFRKEKVDDITEILLRIISNGSEARRFAPMGKAIAKDVNVLEAVEGYVMLLENMIGFPSEVSLPKAVSEIDAPLKHRWRWDVFERFMGMVEGGMRSSKSFDFGFEETTEARKGGDGGSATSADDEGFVYGVWEEEKLSQMAKTRRLMDEEELRDRSEQARGTWEEVYRSAKRADRSRTELHERDERELERTGQPLCIYEPYLGEGSWPFLHRSPLYRGIGLSTRGRRPGEDDIDVASRLPILNDSYYRDALGEYGAFFAIANRTDRVHKNPWIGFQSWRASAFKAALSEYATKTMINSIEARTHGDAFYFWIRMDRDRRYLPPQDFWSFCDSINAGNCRYAFKETMKKMYGLKENLESLPPMPDGNGTWSVMQTWAMSTRSFLEFIMFSRMFVDALDSQFPKNDGHCYLSMYMDKRCYSRVLELLVNVWAYHSARRMIYVDPETGAMQEQHGLTGRKGWMWIRWFTYSTLKSMDEDLAEEWDLDRPSGSWLWPLTGEVLWQGLYDRERNIRLLEKEKRRQKSKDKISRMRGRSRQKVIGRYVKPEPDFRGGSNSTQ